MLVFFYKLFLIVISVLFFGSCSKESFDTGKSVEFSAYEVSTTRSSDCFSEGDAVGIFAYYLEGGIWTDDVYPDFMENVFLENTSDGWIYSPILYWPSMKENQLKFYAYGPHSDKLEPEELSLTLEDGCAPCLNFNITDGKTDILASTPVQMSCPEDATPVLLQFSHVLGKLQFKFAVSSSGSFSHVKKVTLYGINSSAIITWDGDDIVYTLGNTMDYSRAVPSESGFYINSTEHTLVEQFTSYLIPGLITKIGLAWDNTEEIIDISESPLSIQAGKNLSVLITIQKTELSIDAAIEPWKDGGTASGGII